MIRKMQIVAANIRQEEKNTTSTYWRSGARTVTRYSLMIKMQDKRFRADNLAFANGNLDVAIMAEEQSMEKIEAAAKAVDIILSNKEVEEIIFQVHPMIFPTSLHRGLSL